MPCLRLTGLRPPCVTKLGPHPLRLAGLIGNRTSKRDLIDKYIESVPMPVLEILPLIEDIRVSRVKGKTMFEMG